MDFLFVKKKPNNFLSKRKVKRSEEGKQQVTSDDKKEKRKSSKSRKPKKLGIQMKQLRPADGKREMGEALSEDTHATESAL